MGRHVQPGRATPTTFCEFQIIDTTHELAAGIAANAVRIRDVLEVPAG